MNPNNNEQNNATNSPSGAPIAQSIPPAPPAYKEPTSQKILRETGRAMSFIAMLTGLVASIKNLIGKK